MCKIGGECPPFKISFLKESLNCWFTFFGAFSFAQGFVPFLVSATAGTTVYGAFDPLLAVADICKKYKIWMHVDVSILEGPPLKCSRTFCAWSSWNEMYCIFFFTLGIYSQNDDR